MEVVQAMRWSAGATFHTRILRSSILYYLWFELMWENYQAQSVSIIRQTDQGTNPQSCIWHRDRAQKLHSKRWFNFEVGLVSFHVDRMEYGQPGIEWNCRHLNVLQNMLLWNIHSLQVLANLSLPQRHEIIKRVSVGRRSHVQNSVQGPWIIHSFDGIEHALTWAIWELIEVKWRSSMLVQRAHVQFQQIKAWHHDYLPRKLTWIPHLN